MRQNDREESWSDSGNRGVAERELRAGVPVRTFLCTHARWGVGYIHKKRTAVEDGEYGGPSKSGLYRDEC